MTGGDQRDCDCDGGTGPIARPAAEPSTANGRRQQPRRGHQAQHGQQRPARVGRQRAAHLTPQEPGPGRRHAARRARPPEDQVERTRRQPELFVRAVAPFIGRQAPGGRQQCQQQSRRCRQPDALEPAQRASLGTSGSIHAKSASGGRIAIGKCRCKSDLGTIRATHANLMFPDTGRRGKSSPRPVPAALIGKLARSAPRGRMKKKQFRGIVLRLQEKGVSFGRNSRA
jgi:hypothetical protein